MTEKGAQGSPRWDLLVIGGGITGAGILREAARKGLRAALMEQRDFAWGTSSRSSKMVHGGLRYLMTGDWKLTRDSVRQRDKLVREAAGLVDPLGFLFCQYRGRTPGRWSLGALLAVYDLLGGRWNHRYYPAHEFVMLAPRIRTVGLKGGDQYWDAVTDDARLVMRVIQEARKDGALALNYVTVRELMMQGQQVCGVVVEDTMTGESAEISARVVVNATGPWADRLRAGVGGGRDIRPLRGSHLVFPFWRLPVSQAIALKHPKDGRGVFVMPWEGVTLVGSTDLDHEKDLNQEPSCTPEEVAYLLEIVSFLFHGLGISSDHILCTFAGVRPVIGSWKLSPSRERRDHKIWEEQGLISVSGGKLTTFQLIARDVLRQAAKMLPTLRSDDPETPPVFSDLEAAPLDPTEVEPTQRRRLLGRYGRDAPRVVGCAQPGEMTRVPGTDTLWAEIRWAAQQEDVIHLEDLLLRRTRLGILLREGGMVHQDTIRVICQEELGWDKGRWQQESDAYEDLWKGCYGIPTS